MTLVEEAEKLVNDKLHQRVVKAIAHHLECVRNLTAQQQTHLSRITALEQGAAPEPIDLGREDKYR